MKLKRVPFQAVLPEVEGWTPIILKGPMGGLTNFRWFELPTPLDKMVAYAEANADLDVYYSRLSFTPSLQPCQGTRGTRDNVIKQRVWAVSVTTVLSIS